MCARWIVCAPKRDFHLYIPFSFARHGRSGIILRTMLIRESDSKLAGRPRALRVTDNAINFVIYGSHFRMWTCTRETKCDATRRDAARDPRRRWNCDDRLSPAAITIVSLCGTNSRYSSARAREPHCTSHSNKHVVNRRIIRVRRAPPTTRWSPMR